MPCGPFRGVTEEAGEIGSTNQGISIQARYVFLDERQLLTESSAVNDGADAWSGRIYWEDPISPDKQVTYNGIKRFGIQDASQRIPFASLSDGMLELGLREWEGGIFAEKYE